MPRIRAGELDLNYVEHGRGDNVVLAVHGHLGSADWLDLALPLLPSDIRVIVAEWRGCGHSDKPEPAPDYSNYSMATHANDMLALLDALHVRHCHLYGHCAGGMICSHMLTLQPDRFDKVLLLDPVTPLGLKLTPKQIELFSQMRTDGDVLFAALATAAPTLFRPESLVVGEKPRFADSTASAQRNLFIRLVKQTRDLSDGIWFGTPHDLALAWESKQLAGEMHRMRQEHLLLYGKLDYWIPREDVDEMAQQLPNCRLEVFPYVGHSMVLEVPLLFARIFGDYFRRGTETAAPHATGATLQ